LKAIKGKVHLEILSLMKCGIDKENMKLLLIHIQNIPNLRFLNIGENEFNATSDGSLLVNTISKLTNLTSIALNNCNIGNDVMYNLFQGLKKLAFLKEIYITNNNLSDYFAEKIQQKDMKKEFKGLTHFNICGNNLTEKGAGFLGKFLENKYEIQYVRIGSNRIRPDGLKLILRSLEGKGKVTDIDIGENILGDEGATILFKFLEQNKVLEYLNIMKNDISEEKIMNILHLLKRQTIACKINVYGNKIKDETITKYFNSGAQNTSANQTSSHKK